MGGSMAVATAAMMHADQGAPVPRVVPASGVTEFHELVARLSPRLTSRGRDHVRRARGLVSDRPRRIGHAVRNVLDWVGDEVRALGVGVVVGICRGWVAIGIAQVSHHRSSRSGPRGPSPSGCLQTIPSLDVARRPLVCMDDAVGRAT